jgi:hypothetical protein
LPFRAQEMLAKILAGIPWTRIAKSQLAWAQETLAKFLAGASCEKLESQTPV